MFSFDFDGTLAIPGGTPQVSPEFFELLSDWRESHQIYWGINTGRSLMFAVQGLAEADFPFLPDYIIAREREIYTPNEFRRWVAVSKWNERCDKAHRRLFRKHHRFLKDTQQWVERETGAVWGLQAEEPAGIVSSTAEEMDGIVKRLDLELPGKKMLSYQRNGIYLRFSHGDYHKGTAMAEMARLIGLDAGQTLAVGDSHNDLDMLDPSLAAHLACPSNACDEVKQAVYAHGGYVGEGVASHGVVESLVALMNRVDGVA